MRDLKKRLNELETQRPDHISRLEFIDYIGIEPYDNGNWLMIDDTDPTIIVIQNKLTGDVRGLYNDRRSTEEIQSAGGNLAYL